jgi:hypothetical protein
VYNYLSFAAAVAAVMGGVAWLVAAMMEAKERRRKPESVLNTVAAGLSLLGAVLLSIATSDVVTRSPELIAATISNVYFTPVWFLIALGLFWSRGYLPRSYGLAEVFVGMTAVFYAVKSEPADFPPKLLALASGIYIIVRGLDNFEKGLPPGVGAAWRKIFWKA